MPRSIRHEYAGAHYHAMCRGNNGQEIFRTDEGRRLFLATLGEVCHQVGWRIHAYCLRSNHYHLLLETPEANLAEGMKWFQGTNYGGIIAVRGAWQSTSARKGSSRFYRHSTYLTPPSFKMTKCKG